MKSLKMCATVASVTAGATILALACGGSAGGVSVGDAAAGDDLGADAAVDAADAGPGASADAPHDSGSPVGCPSGRGPIMVSIPAADGGTFCIDSTEVTNAQYAAFVAVTTGGPSGLPSDCSWKTAFTPGDRQDGGCASDYDPVARADYPVDCVDWCDAYAFCQWAGKALCITSYAPGLSDTTIGWQRACTSGGTHAYVYGDTMEAGACNINGSHGALLPVGSATACQSPDPAYRGVFDLLGNVDEWMADCPGPVDGGALASCTTAGGDFVASGATSCLSTAFAPAPRLAQEIGTGIRCCSAQ
jgi:sulfatase modifying factor 1